MVCRDSRGEPADTAFGLSFHPDTSVIGRTDREFTAVASGAPGANVVHPESGFYRMRIPGIGSQSGLAAASAVGEGDAHCHVERWFQDGADMITDVRCWSAGRNARRTPGWKQFRESLVVTGRFG